MTTPLPLQRARQYTANDQLPFLRTNSSEQPVILKALDVQVKVTGLFAETTQTLIFFNPNHRDLEGELRFPLPDNAMVCGYALDVQGEMVDGVVVPKAKARRVLETEIRKGVDPGLIEQVQGNLYTTRIYPVPAEGTRTIRVTYVSDLAVNGQSASYHLPLGHAAGIDQATLRVEVLQSPVTPIVQLDDNTTLSGWSNRWVAETNLDTAAPVPDLLVQLPQLPDQCVFCEQYNGETFFAVNLQTGPTSHTPWQPRKIAVAWDASGSRCPDEATANGHKKALELLTAMFKQWQLERVDLLVFRHAAADQSLSFTSASALTEFLSTIAYDGATALGELDFRTFAPDVEACFLFTDGLESAAQEKSPVIGSAPLLTINASATCNSTLLSHLATISRGQYINLLRCPVTEALAIIEQTGNSLSFADTTGTTDLLSTTSNGRFTVFGKLVADRGTLRLAGMAAPAQPLELTGIDAAESSAIARCWAGNKVRTLEATAANTEELLTFCRQYGIVSQATSLLVLESLEQYLEHEVEPPSSLPVMRRNYLRMMNVRQLNEEKQREEHIDRVVALWQKRKAWWERDFKAEYLQHLEREKLVKLLSRPGSIRGPQQFTPPDSSHESASFCLMDAHESLDDTPERLGDFIAESDEEEAPSRLPTPAASIALQAWEPGTPYLQLLRDAAPQERYATYLHLRKDYSSSPSFFLDCAHFFLEQGETETGLLILSNLLELRLNDVALLRIYGWRLQQAGRLDLAIPVFERIRTMRDDEPQSHRDLALALSERWQAEHATPDLTRAMHLLYQVVSREWDRFKEIELIALMELNRLAWLAGQHNIPTPNRIDSRLLDQLDVDIRISLSWDADLTDVDLHVFEPDGGHAYYSHPLTRQGGLVSRDFTQGYGPEEYILRLAMPGKYQIKAHYYGSHQQTVCGPCTVTATVFTNFGRPAEQQQTMSLRLDQASDQHLVGEVEIAGNPWPTDLPIAPRKPPRANLTLQHFQALHLGMTISNIVSKVGTPDVVEGMDAILLAYQLNEEESVQIILAPRLESATLLTPAGATVFMKKAHRQQKSKTKNRRIQIGNTRCAVTCLEVSKRLKNHGYITSKMYEEAKSIHLRTGGRLDTILLELGYIERDTLCNFISRNTSFEMISLERREVNQVALEVLSYTVAKRYLTLPIDIEGDMLHAAMVDPTDDNLITELEKVTGMTIRPSVAYEFELIDYLDSYYGVNNETICND